VLSLQDYGNTATQGEQLSRVSSVQFAPGERGSELDTAQLLDDAANLSERTRRANIGPIRMIEFRFAVHSARRSQVIEVFLDGRLCAAIYPGETSIRVISRCFKHPFHFDEGRSSRPPVPALTVGFAFEEDDGDQDA
jgi:hypothetical protein